MSIFRICFFCLFVLNFFVFGNALSQQQPTYERVYLSGKDAASKVYWDFMISDGRKKGEWTKILVPSNWEMQGFGAFSYGENDGVLGSEIGHYRHKFSAASSWKRKKVYLTVENSVSDMEVKINGEVIEQIHLGDATRLSYDISNLLNYRGDNLLEIIVSKYINNQQFKDNSILSESKVLGGISRPVFLEILPELHFTSVAIDARADGQFTSLINLSEVPNKAEIQVEISDKYTGENVGSFSTEVLSDSVALSHLFPKVKSWSHESPSLYVATLTLLQNGKKVYSKTEIIGFRTIEIVGKDELLINGVNVKLKGAQYRELYPTTGTGLSEKHLLEDALLMKEAHMNSVFFFDGVPSGRFLELADSLGIYVFTEHFSLEKASMHPSLVKGGSVLDISDESLEFFEYAVVRDDKGGVLESWDDSSAEVILGPYREKSRLFYAMKNLWSPIQIAPFDPAASFSGKIQVSNTYRFSEPLDYRIKWSLEKIESWEGVHLLDSDSVPLSSLNFGEKIEIDLHLPANWREGDLLRVLAIGPNGETLFSNTKAIRKPIASNPRYFQSRETLKSSAITVRESLTELHISAGNRLFVFGKERGELRLVKVGRRMINFSQTIVSENYGNAGSKVTWKRLKDSSIQIKSIFDHNPKSISWTIFPSGELLMEAAAPVPNNAYKGLGFSYSKENVRRLQWIGNGPYPVWSNRMDGVEFGLWEYDYNKNTSSGEWDKTSYTKVKGYYSNLHALRLTTDQGNIEVRTETPDLFLRLFNPEVELNPTMSQLETFVESDLGFLYAIPGLVNFYPDSESQTFEKTFPPIVLWFRFE